jgi:membrane protein implicated in regulation of membrane protease activity
VNDLLAFLFSPWGWLSLAAVTAGLEMLLPGAYMIWVAAAALATAVTTAVVATTPDGQLGAFALFIVIALLLSRQLKARAPIQSDDPALNRLGLRVAGQAGIVTEAISGGRGRVRLGDSEWLAEGPDAAQGARVRVLGANGAVLQVAPESALPQPDPDDPA